MATNYFKNRPVKCLKHWFLVWLSFFSEKIAQAGGGANLLFFIYILSLNSTLDHSATAPSL